MCMGENKGIKLCYIDGWLRFCASDKGACPVAASRKDPWAMSTMKPVKVAMPNCLFAERGILSLFNYYESLAKTI